MIGRTVLLLNCSDGDAPLLTVPVFLLHCSPQELQASLCPGWEQRVPGGLAGGLEAWVGTAGAGAGGGVGGAAQCLRM